MRVLQRMTSSKYVCQRPGYLVVDFRDGVDPVQIVHAYRHFAAVCIEKSMQRALVAAGDDPPNAHYALRDAFTAMVLAAGIPSAFRLALIASTSRIEAVFRAIERDFRVLGIDTRIFADEHQALAWVEEQPMQRAP